MALVSRTSSRRGLPWASAVSVLWGEGQPMWLRSRINDGLSSTAMARRSAASMASVSLATSPMLSVCQP